MTDNQRRSQPRAVLIGAHGKQGQEYLYSLQGVVRWVGLVDPLLVTSGIDGLPGFRSVQEAIDQVDFELALVAVPHQPQFEISQTLLRAGKDVIKEKPFALTTREAWKLAELSQGSGKMMLTLVQRNFRRPFRMAGQELASIGTPYSYRYDYHIDLVGPTLGWRADRELSGGGVLWDMGYHPLDILGRMFGPPQQVAAAFSYCYPEMRHRELEDVVSMTLQYGSGLLGTIVISRHHYRRHEALEVLGTEGAIVVGPSGYRRYARDGKVIAKSAETRPRHLVNAEMVGAYDRMRTRPDHLAAHLAHHIGVVATIEAAYASARGAPHALPRADNTAALRVLTHSARDLSGFA